MSTNRSDLRLPEEISDKPDEIVWGVADLDRTPVGDLEDWHRKYDPVAVGAFERLLDEAFGPLGGAR